MENKLLTEEDRPDDWRFREVLNNSTPWNDWVIELLKAQHTKTIAKFREVVEGAGLTPEEQDAVQFRINAGWETGCAETWCKAQLQAILKALEGEQDDYSGEGHPRMPW